MIQFQSAFLFFLPVSNDIFWLATVSQSGQYNKRIRANLMENGSCYSILRLDLNNFFKLEIERVFGPKSQTETLVSKDIYIYIGFCDHKLLSPPVEGLVVHPTFNDMEEDSILL